MLLVVLLERLLERRHRDTEPRRLEHQERPAGLRAHQDGHVRDGGFGRALNELVDAVETVEGEHVADRHLAAPPGEQIGNRGHLGQSLLTGGMSSD